MAPKTITDDTVTYEKPFKIPGAISLSLEAKGELTAFYADGIKYYVASSNGGYEGDLEMAMIPDKFRQLILNEILDENKVMFENANAVPKEFAFGFEIDGDLRSTRFWFYNCTSTRPNVESSTTEETKEPTTDKVSISCAASEDGTVRAKTTPEVNDDIYNKWFDSVYIKQDTPIGA